MIEKTEWENLKQLATQIDLSAPDAQVIEVGTFFGKSTAGILAGLLNNQTLDLSNRTLPAFLAIDSFACSIETNNFASYVRFYANKHQLDHLLHTQGNTLDFKPIFDHFLAKFEQGEQGKAALMKSVRSEIQNLPACTGHIRLLHLDAPKYYTEMKYILEQHFPHLRLGAMIIFQDYFYHWSGTIIAAITLLIDGGWLEPVRGVCSSLVCTVKKTITQDDLLWLDKKMQSDHLPDLLTLAHEQIKTLPVLRAADFIPRIFLAKAQLEYETRDYPAASRTIASAFMLNGRELSPLVINDVLELISRNFNNRASYEEDHRMDAQEPLATTE